MNTGIPVLSVKNVGKSFKVDGKQFSAVDDMSFDVQRGETLALLGPNGAGKTTMMKIASGLIIPENGRVLINGCDPHKKPRVRRRLGTVLEGNRNLFWRLTAAENLRYFAVLKGMRLFRCGNRIDDVLERFELIDKKNTQVRNLSRGMQQRLALAKCWLHKPDLVILDEPALGLDIHSRNSLLDMIVELARVGTGVILTTHNLDIAQRISDRVVIVNDGKILRMANTHTLIEEYSGIKYVISIDGTLSEKQIDILCSRFNANLYGNEIIVHGKPDKIYDIIPVIQPVNINSVNKYSPDLSDIFQYITGDNQDV